MTRAANFSFCMLHGKRYCAIVARMVNQSELTRMQPKYLVQRRRTLAYGNASAPVDLLGSFVEPWTAESEDFANVADALQLYAEQAARDYYRMFSILHSTAGRAVATRVEAEEEFARGRQ